MSEYAYSAMGHNVRCANGDSFFFYWSTNNGQWMVRDNGHLLYVGQLRLFLQREEEMLEEAL